MPDRVVHFFCNLNLYCSVNALIISLVVYYFLSVDSSDQSYCLCCFIYLFLFCGINSVGTLTLLLGFCLFYLLITNQANPIRSHSGVASFTTLLVPSYEYKFFLSKIKATMRKEKKVKQVVLIFFIINNFTSNKFIKYKYHIFIIYHYKIL